MTFAVWKSWAVAAFLALGACGGHEAPDAPDAGVAPAADSMGVGQDVTAAPATAAAPGLEGWKGRYAKTHDNGLASGETFPTTDEMDILPIDGRDVFLRASLTFFNGHICLVSGVAQLETDPAMGETIVLRGTEDGLYPDCALALSRPGDQIRFADPGGACAAASCGARGSYEGYEIPLGSRIPHSDIDLQAIRTSDDFLVATGQKAGERQ